MSRLCVAFLVAGALTCSQDNTNPNPEPTKLAVATQPSSTAHNGEDLAVQPAVQVQDADGNSIPAASGATVTAALSGAGGTLNGTLTQAVDASGKATFTDLSISGPSGTYQIQFSSTGLTGATSNDVVLDGGPPATITVNTQPTSALDKEVFDPTVQPVVTVTDAGGNAVPSVLVTASIGSGTGTLQGRDTATTDASGVARFTDLGISGAGSQILEFSADPATGTSSPINIATLPAEAASGKWDPAVAWDIVPLHIHLLPTGKILAWGKFENGTMVMGDPRLWDPATGPPTTATTVPADTMLFCAGHSFMSDGTLLVSGGHKLDDRGLDVTNFFNPATQTWTAGPKMAKGRWYPTVTELPDGRMVTVAGKDTTKSVVLIPEIWGDPTDPNHWVQLPGASLTLPYYPRDFLAPDGRIFMAGERTTSRWLDVDATGPGGRGTWTPGPAHIWPFNRDYGSAVMYDVGKILYVGGGGDLTWDTPDPKNNTPTATAERIDLTQASPTWQSAGSLPTPRRHLNATVLPDGEVLVTGGLSGGGFNNLATAQHAAEIWDPANPTVWTQLASNAVDRGYHSVSLLLPDATVLHGGSGNATIPGTSTPYPDEESHEIFHPPYLFKGARPTITTAPNTVAAGASFTVATPNAAQITTVRIIRLGSVTHAFDQNGRALTLPFVVSGSGLNVTAQADHKLAPPGHYLLFILNRNGVPSNGSVVQFQ
ncbi:MAG TPA: galactose oxidase-like domain-containing protein [Gemmatimonadales bacterium]